MVRLHRAQQLPAAIPVFAVSGAVLFPGNRLPLVVFEPRYLALVDDCLGAGRLLALVQPQGSGEPAAANEEVQAMAGLHRVGTLGRISAFGEASDGRYLITLTGISRFRITGEEPRIHAYRRILVDYSDFAADGDEPPVTLPDRERLLILIRAQLDHLGLGAELDALDNLSDRELVDRMAMACPFSPEEKQALLESPTHIDRCRMMIAMIERGMLSAAGSSSMH